MKFNIPDAGVRLLPSVAKGALPNGVAKLEKPILLRPNGTALAVRTMDPIR